MTPDLVRFIRHVRVAFRGLPLEQLYQVALALRDELAARSCNTAPEADALVAALLADVRVQRNRLFAGFAAPAEES